MATILGTLQSTLTYFPYLRKVWQRNTEEERLLGVSLLGSWTMPLVQRKKCPKWLEMRSVAETNQKFAAE